MDQSIFKSKNHPCINNGMKEELILKGLMQPLSVEEIIVYLRKLAD